jgi:hypothetical protein
MSVRTASGGGGGGEGGGERGGGGGGALPPTLYVPPPQVGRRADQLDLIGPFEQRRGPLADQVVILREDHAYHAGIVQGREGATA